MSFVRVPAGFGSAVLSPAAQFAGDMAQDYAAIQAVPVDLGLAK